ncbi:MAG TPA: serine/threonine-protein kinase [Mycobacteriales bacterium]
MDTGYRVGGRYTLRTTIGTGGMGTVWGAHDEVLRRPVAIKEVTFPRGLPTAEQEMLCERTLREARAAAALNHPAVVRVFDVVEDDGRPWIVMELLEARSLADIVRLDGPLPPHTVAAIGLAVLGALQTAHDAGVLHRDVKPGNVLVGADGRTTLTDFGVARSPGESPLTSTGLLLGSPQYIAPERARGQACGPPSDLWSLGATLYAAVEGRAPFDQGDPLPTMTAIVSEPPQPMTFAGPLAPVLTGLLTKDPAERFDHARARRGLAAVAAAGPAAATPPPPSATQPTVPLPRGPLQPPPGSTAPRNTAPGSTAPGNTAPQGNPAPAAPPRRPVAALTRPVAALTRRIATLSRPVATRTRPMAALAARTAANPRRAALVGAAVVVAVVFGLLSYAIGTALLDRTPGGVAAVAPGGTARVAGLRLTTFEHPSGTFSVQVPEGWTKRQFENGRFRFYSADESQFVQVDTMATRSDSQRAVWEAAERFVANGGGDVTRYARVGDFGHARLAGHDALDWEWTFVHGRTGTPRHAVERGAIIDGVSYQLYLSGPEQDFARIRPLLDAVASSFRLTTEVAAPGG